MDEENHVQKQLHTNQHCIAVIVLGSRKVALGLNNFEDSNLFVYFLKYNGFEIFEVVVDFAILKSCVFNKRKPPW